VDPGRDPSLDDGALIEAAQHGDVRALGALIDLHQGRVLRVLAFLGVRREDREDVAQEVFIRVLRYLEGFRRGQPFSAWIYRVTVNAAHDWAGRAGRHGGMDLAGDEAALERLEDPAEDPATAALNADLRRRLGRAMDGLSARERAVFTLRELEGLESREVARVLGISQITVRRHLGRALRHLRAELDPETLENHEESGFLPHPEKKLAGR
jgi:RNA polymerase sigma-70 factor (ECF subfamily)